MSGDMLNKRKQDKIMIHGYPVWAEWRPDDIVVYHCPWDECEFATQFPCDSDDVECRLDAYVEMHDHIKAHEEDI